MYLGHDRLIQALLISMGINATRPPEFASQLIFEIYENNLQEDIDDDYFIVMKYNGKIREIKNCGK